MNECTRCKGTGKIPDGGIRVPDKVVCDVCGGTGKKYVYDLMEDLQITLASKLPSTKQYKKGPDYKYQVLSDYVMSIQAIGNDTYEILMKNLDRIRAEKKERWRSWWVFTLPDGKTMNTKFTSPNLLREYAFEKFFTDEEQLEWCLQNVDHTAGFSDDHRCWASAQAMGMKIVSLKEKMMRDGKENEVKVLVEKYTPKRKDG